MDAAREPARAVPRRHRDLRRSVTASTFGASLELAREGKIELRQIEPFAPLYIRDRPPAVALVNPEASNG